MKQRTPTPAIISNKLKKRGKTLLGMGAGVVTHGFPDLGRPTGEPKNGISKGKEKIPGELSRSAPGGRALPRREKVTRKLKNSQDKTYLVPPAQGRSKKREMGSTPD